MYLRACVYPLVLCWYSSMTVILVCAFVTTSLFYVATYVSVVRKFRVSCSGRFSLTRVTFHLRDSLVSSPTSLPQDVCCPQLPSVCICVYITPFIKPLPLPLPPSPPHRTWMLSCSLVRTRRRWRRAPLPTKSADSCRRHSTKQTR